MSSAALTTFWFLLIGLFWIGYFFLEGFDFGVGILSPFLSRDDADRRLVIGTIGPVWDGNEVWLIVAAGATFAAFPEWYATLFSGFYLALLLILFGLIWRAVAFEFRNQERGARWRSWWDRGIFWGSALPAFIWGVAFADMLAGIPIGPGHEYRGSVIDLLQPYALLGGVTFLLLFTLHGAVFIALKTTEDMSERARKAAQWLALPAAAALLAFLTWSFLNAVATNNKGAVQDYVPLTALGAALAVAWLVRERLMGFAFAATASAIVLLVATIFLNLYPRVMTSSLGSQFDLTISNASSSPYTLGLMTVLALIAAPLVFAYQAWTYWIFRKRIGRSDLTEAH